MAGEVRSRVSHACLGYLLGRAGRHDASTRAPAFGTEVDDPVGSGDHVQVVLNDDDGVSVVHQPLKDVHQPVDVRRMQPRRWLVQHVERARLPQLGGQLQALALTAGQRGERLSQGEIAQPYLA
jgi:hypothetical protein